MHELSCRNEKLTWGRTVSSRLIGVRLSGQILPREQEGRWQLDTSDDFASKIRNTTENGEIAEIPTERGTYEIITQRVT